MASQVMSLPPDQRSTFVTKMHRRGYRIIVVTRRDTLARAVSRLEAARTQRWRSDAGKTDRAPLVITPEEIESELDFAERSLAFVEDAVRQLPNIRITYEDDLETPEAQQATLDRICAELRLPSAKVPSVLPWGGARSMRDRIANHDEVMDHLRRSRFAAYAEPHAETPPAP